jgi:hypothetical protein
VYQRAAAALSCRASLASLIARAAKHFQRAGESGQLRNRGEARRTPIAPTITTSHDETEKFHV